jgi:hypothetical protein
MKDELILKLKKKYDEKNVAEVEKDVDHFKKHSRSAEKSMIETLHYLETTERFKENPTYKNSTFSEYIMDRFCIRHTTYMNLRMAFHNYREESLKYGPGFIASIKEKCGTTKIKTVLDEIKVADKKAKDPITRKKMDVIVKKHLRSKPKKKQGCESPVDWKAKYETEHAALIATEKELDRANEQIARLKETVLRLNAAKQAIEQAAMVFRDARDQLAA